MKALVIHPRFYIYGGGELLCLYVCKTLQDIGYDVSLVCDRFDPDAVERIYGMGNVMRKCDHIPVPDFKPFRPPLPKIRLLALQRLFYTRRIKKALSTFPGDVVFSTQSSIYTITGRPVYHFLYDIVDLFAYPAPLHQAALYAYYGRMPIGGLGLHWRMYYTFLAGMRDLLIGDPTPKRFFALSNQVHRDLIARGYRNATVIYPPARLDFMPRRKKRQVVTVSRIVPQKRLEMFFEVARCMPEIPFILVGRDDPELRRLNPGYSEKLFRDKPSNVDYVESPIKEVPWLLEESKVYLYCGIEPGLGIAMMEACGAGCVPVAPGLGGGGEVIDAVSEGLIFRNAEEAVRAVRLALEWDSRPEDIRKSAVAAFSPEAFQKSIRSVLE